MKNFCKLKIREFFKKSFSNQQQKELIQYNINNLINGLNDIKNDPMSYNDYNSVVLKECQSLLLLGRISEARKLLTTQYYSDEPNDHNNNNRAVIASSLDLKIPNLSLANSFIEGYLTMGSNAAIGTATDLLYSLGCRANAISYALFIRYYLKKKDYASVRSIIGEMRKRSFVRIEGIFETDLFNQTSIELLKKLSGVALNLPTSTPITKLKDEERVDVREEVKKINIIEKRKIDIPQVAPISSQGGGIFFIKNSISSLLSIPLSAIYTDPEMVQKQLERDCLKSAVDQLKQQWHSLQDHSNKPANVIGSKWIITKWAFQLSEALKQSLSLPSRSAHLQNFNSILGMLGPEKTALIILQELLKMGRYSFDLGAQGDCRTTLWPGCNYTFLCGDIGKSIEQELFAEQISQNQYVSRYYRSNSGEKEKNDKVTLKELVLKTKIARDLMHSRTRNKTIDKIQQVMMGDEQASQKGWMGKFPMETKYEIGAYCLDFALKNLVNELGADEDNSDITNVKSQKPFVHQIIKNPFSSNKKLGIVRMDRKLYDRFSEPTGELLENLGVQPWTLPMISPPKPWKSLTQGGYFSFESECVRYREDPSHLALLMQADQNGQLERVYESLNYLGSTPWSINNKVLLVALELWNKGLDVTNLNGPTSQKDSSNNNNNPEDTEFEMFVFKPRDQFASHEEYCQYVRKCISQKKQMSNTHSTKCDTNYKLELARAYSGLTFYFPHNVDFRGRAYPIPPHLNHLGSDLSRGLLLFSEAKELGKDGLSWLKVQLANMLGKDKLPFSERIKYIDSVLDKVHRVVANPLDTEEKNFWQKSDEPWQCLAACFEVSEAVKDPINFKSRLPVQQDGSCNGLQHYASLGGDEWGASQVNLLPSDSPQDIYGTVAKIVNEELSRLAETNALAAKLKETISVSRRIVKTPVMTNVYGVTSYGAKKQIASNIKEVYGEDALGGDLGKASDLLAKLVFKALDTLFVQARRIQNWLTNAAQLIGRAELPSDNTNEGDTKFGSLVTWTSPIGFPVIQPYHKQNSVHLRTTLQTITLSCPDSNRIDVSKQAAGFPPNFIHSLDASHMFLTSERCRNHKITFASVHDCFWTHAGTVHIMAEQLREAFVELHQKPILENLRHEMIERYNGYMVKRKDGKTEPIKFPPIPERGPLDINSVKQSLYFFS